MLKIKAFVKRISDILVAFYIELKLLQDERYFDDRLYHLARPFLLSWCSWLGGISKEEADDVIRQYIASRQADDYVSPWYATKRLPGEFVRRMRSWVKSLDEKT